MENKSCYHYLHLDEYHGLVKNIAEFRKQELIRLFNPLQKKFGHNDWSLIIVGSDGKQERHPQSKTEIVFLYRNGSNKTKKLMNEMNNLINLSIEPIEFNEAKPVGDQNVLLSFYKNQSNDCYPDRIINANFLLGENNLFIEAKKQTLLEMAGNNEQGKKIREKISSQLKDYIKTLKSGQYRSQVVFDENQQYYFETDNWKNVKTGFKMGPLRTIQRKVDLLLINIIRENKLTINAVATTYPSNTCERIEFLAEKGLIEEQIGKEISQAYLWFLKEYHKIQELFKNSNRLSPISCPFNPQDFQHYKQIILNFVS
jgi:hypothetical protein